MKKSYLLFLLVFLISCAGKYVRPIAEYHQKLLNAPSPNYVYEENEWRFKPWTIGQYVRYSTKLDQRAIISEFAITGQENDAYWLEIKFAGNAWGYKYLVQLSSNSSSLVDFFNQKIKILKGYYYRLDLNSNKWIYSKEKDGVNISVWYSDYKYLANILSLAKGYDGNLVGPVGINRERINSLKVKGGIFSDPAKVKYQMSILTEDRPVAFFLHSAIPVFGVAFFDTFYGSMELVEFKEDFKGSLFVPYPVE